MPPLIMRQQLSEAVKSMTFIEPVPYKKAKLDTSTGKAQYHLPIIALNICDRFHPSSSILFQR